MTELCLPEFANRVVPVSYRNTVRHLYHCGVTENGLICTRLNRSLLGVYGFPFMQPKTPKQALRIPDIIFVSVFGANAVFIPMTQPRQAPGLIFRFEGGLKAWNLNTTREGEEEGKRGEGGRGGEFCRSI